MIGHALWHCPSMCGCALDIDAQWTDDIPNGGLSYRHPIPGTINSIAIQTVCPTHASLTTDPLPPDPWFGTRGYMTVPATPTAAENLYIHLCRFTAQKSKPDTCTCAIYEVIDRSGGPLARVAHPKHRVKCPVHDDDDDDGRDALADNVRKNRIVERASTLLGIPTTNIRWEFSGVRRTRHLTVTLIGASGAQVTQAQTWADNNYPGRITVVAG